MADSAGDNKTMSDTKVVGEPEAEGKPVETTTPSDDHVADKEGVQKDETSTTTPKDSEPMEVGESVEGDKAKADEETPKVAKPEAATNQVTQESETEKTAEKSSPSEKEATTLKGSTETEDTPTDKSGDVPAASAPDATPPAPTVTPATPTEAPAPAEADKTTTVPVVASAQEAPAAPNPPPVAANPAPVVEKPVVPVAAAAPGADPPCVPISNPLPAAPPPPPYTTADTDDAGTDEAETADEETMDTGGDDSLTQEEVEEKLEPSREVKHKSLAGCYCCGPRNIGSTELLCGICFKFFHVGCLTTIVGRVVPFMTNYSFFCKRCNLQGSESFNKKQATFSQMCVTAIANLMFDNPRKMLFSKDKEIIPFIDRNWESLTTIPRRVKLTWHTTVFKAMLKELRETFTMSEEDSTDIKFGLIEQDLSKVGPNYDAMFKAPATVHKTELKADSSRDMLPLQTKTRGTKRKNPDTQVTVYGLKAKKGEVHSTRVAPSGYPSEHPHNKDGYRYILAEPDPHAPNREAFDASLEWAGKPIPGYLYRTWLDQNVLLALHDRAPQLKLSDDRITLVSGEKGYCMVRATHGVGRGAWYFEVSVCSMPPEAATRIGWSQQLGNLQAPCGYDKFSYSWRSKKGTRFHQSRGKHYTDVGYGENDVLGFYVSLPQQKDPNKLLPPTSKDKPLVKFKSHLYFEEKDHIADTEKALKPLEGSKMVMYKNGVNQGVAFEDIFQGVYYPAVSVYKTASVSMNFGPDFKYPPKDQGDFRPFSEAAHEAVVEHALADILYHVEHEGQFPEF